jgi:RNA polymerase sigma factor (sigma-70 family)
MGSSFFAAAYYHTSTNLLSGANTLPESCVYQGVTDVAMELADAGQVSDETAEPHLGQLFDAHHQRLYRLASRLLSSGDEARDLVQETFLRAARSPGSIPCGRPNQEAWLVRVLVNLCRDRWRKREVQRRFLTMQTSSEIDRATPASESALIAQTVIWRGLRALPPRRRAVMVMHELDGASVADIAGVLGIASVTVRWHLSQGRRELSRLVKDTVR